jgi:hypothetical protein
MSKADLTMRFSLGLFLKAISGAALSLGAFVPAYAGPVNLGPDSGWLLNLSGSPILAGAVQYTTTFTATAAFTDLSFEFRQDGAFLSFSNVSAIDKAGGGNLLLNGDFASGLLGTSSVDSWTYSNPEGVSYGGVLLSGCGYLSSNCWYDGAVQGYDSLSQTIETVVGHSYTVSFWLNGGSPGLNYSALSTNGQTRDISGNGADLVLYARAAVPVVAPPPVPEASTWAMMGAGFAGLGLLAHLRSRKVRASA